MNSAPLPNPFSKFLYQKNPKKLPDVNQILTELIFISFTEFPKICNRYPHLDKFADSVFHFSYVTG